MIDIERKNKIQGIINASPYLNKINMADFEIKPFDKIQGFAFIMPIDNSLHKTIEEAEYQRLLTIYHALNKLEREDKEVKRKEQELIEQKKRENLQGFEKGLTRMQLGKILATLDKIENFRGGEVQGCMSRREFVEKYFSKLKLQIICGKHYCLGGYDIGKTAFEYCSFLQDKEAL